MSASKFADFQVLGHLGTGSFGSVYKVRRTMDAQVYVLKKIMLRGMSPKEQRDAVNEVKVMARVESKHVVRYYDSFIEDGSLHIIMEYCEKGDLEGLFRSISRDANGERLERAKTKKLSERAVWRMFLQMAHGGCFVDLSDLWEGGTAHSPFCAMLFTLLRSCILRLY